MPLIAATALLLACTATDGDTLRCGDERVRLVGIDAPELHGCRRGRQCVPGDGMTARDHLAALITLGPLSIERVGTDAYGRTLGVVYLQGTNLSCAMIFGGQAQYVARWDNGGAVARDCPQLTRR